MTIALGKCSCVCGPQFRFLFYSCSQGGEGAEFCPSAGCYATAVGAVNAYNMNSIPWGDISIYGEVAGDACTFNAVGTGPNWPEFFPQLMFDPRPWGYGAWSSASILNFTCASGALTYAFTLVRCQILFQTVQTLNIGEWDWTDETTWTGAPGSWAADDCCDNASDGYGSCSLTPVAGGYILDIPLPSYASAIPDLAGAGSDTFTTYRLYGASSCAEWP